ncbi:hypothetical protein KCU62_g2952, partial [Aureobasidium sp. EXF-3399]
MVVCSIFCAHEDEDYDSWTARAIDSEWHKDSHGYSIDIVVSKIRTVLETNGKNTPVVHRIRFLVWLGLLTQCWHEAELLKWLACQEYLLYLCRGGTVDFGIDLWLDTLCKRTKQALPRLHSDLSVLLTTVGMRSRKGTDYAITEPNTVFREPRIVQSLASGHGLDAWPRNISPPTNQQINNKPQIELQTAVHLRALQDKEVMLETALKVSGLRLLKRRDDLAAYCEQIDNIPTCQGQELDTIMPVSKFAQAAEHNDMEMWRRLDMERQSIRITIGRLQKLLGIEKKMNHNRNKNKNRAAKKKEKKLQQGKATANQGDTDHEAEAEAEVEPPSI